MAEFERPPLPYVDVIYGGGTISSVLTKGGYREGGHAFHLTSLMELPDAPTDFLIGDETAPYTGLSENMRRRDEADITGGMHKAILRGHNAVITHGTDTLEHMAKYAENAIGHAARTKGVKMVLTGANEDMSHPETDVWTNLAFALKMAGSGETPAGVYVAYHGRLIPATETAKLPYLPGATPTFVSEKSSEYREARDKQHALIESQRNALITANHQQPDGLVADYNVNTIRVDHQKFLTQLLANPGIKNVLLKLYHSGTANANPDTPRASVVELANVLRYKRPDLVIFGATETGEPTDLHAYETSVRLREAGVVPLYDMYHDVAMTKLRLMGPRWSARHRIEFMLTNQIGEIAPDIRTKYEDDIKQLVRLYEARPRRIAAAA